MLKWVTQILMMDKVITMVPFLRLWMLRFRLAPLKREWLGALLELGETVYTLFRQGEQEIRRERLQEKYQQLLSLEEEIEDLKEEMALLRGCKPRKRCPSCGKYIEEDANYCSYCGIEQKK